MTKPPTRTLLDIAQAHGWHYSQMGQRASTDYLFTKGRMRVRFSRAGHGQLSIQWNGRRVPWKAIVLIPTPEGDSRVTLYGNTREEYADALLPMVTEEECIRRIEEALAAELKAAKERAEKLQTEFNDFCQDVVQIRLAAKQ